MNIIKTIIIVFLCLILSGATERYRVPETFAPSNKQIWENLGNKIIDSKADNIILLWKGDGGYNDIADIFIAQLKTAQRRGKIITFEVVGEAVSNHAIVTCYGDNLTLDKEGVLIFHQAFYPLQSSYVKHKVYMRDIDDRMIECFVKNILFFDEIYQISRKHVRLEITNGNRLFKPDYTDYEAPK